MTLAHVGLLLLWTLFCIAIGVLLSRRVIITTTDLYAAMWHDARETKQFARQKEQEFAAFLAKVKGKAEEAKKIIT